MTAIKPAPNFILAAPSPVDTREESRPSGLIVAREQTTRLYRAVVIAWQEGMMPINLELENGTLIYYTQYLEISEHHLVQMNHVVALEN